jgi:hypothetical protein
VIGRNLVAGGRGLLMSEPRCVPWPERTALVTRTNLMRDVAAFHRLGIAFSLAHYWPAVGTGEERGAHHLAQVVNRCN